MKITKYEIESFELCIPLLYDEKSSKYIEDYREYIENTKYTPAGFRIMFAGEDACKFSEENIPGGCPDCGSCKYYKRAGEHTLIGICTNEFKRFKEEKEWET